MIQVTSAIWLANFVQEIDVIATVRDKQIWVI